ncbi:gamma-glutamyltransferase [bacterium]|nr:gamma-glutamyltransferase [bacterium]
MPVLSVVKPVRAVATPILALAIGIAACSRPRQGAGDAATAFAPRGVVTSASPEATEAGLEILRRGGNAIDAAAAVQFALGVTEPAMSGLGGQSQMIVAAPGEAPFVINGTSFGPAKLPLGEVPRSQFTTGWTSTTVPSTVRVMDYAMRAYGGGEVGWDEVLAPAIRYAEDGFRVGRFRALVYARHEEDLRASPTAAPLFLIDGAAPKEGDIVRQPVLAETLRRLASAGAQDFYTGDIAAQIAADMAGNGGWLTAEDLAATPDPRVEPALHTTYRGFDVYTLPPPAGGWVVLAALNLLDLDDASVLGAETPERAREMLDALQRAHWSRDRNSETAADAFEADLRQRISKEAARDLARSTLNIQRESHQPGGETTHFSVVDSDGLAVSVTTSIDSYFGARVASPTLGFLYNNYMQSLDREPGRAFSIAPRARPYSSMSASIVQRGGETQLVLGSPGSARIISAVTQMISHWADVGAGVERAVAAPRVHVVPDDDGRDNAYVEVPPDGLDVAALGLDPTSPSQDLVIGGLNAYFGGVHAIAREGGTWVGAADPRRDGTVGYAETGGR